MTTMAAAHTILYHLIIYMQQHACVSTREELSSTIKIFTKHLNALCGRQQLPEFEPAMQSMTEFRK